jgi:hypothetical protein
MSEGASEGDDYKTPSFHHQPYFIYWIMRFMCWIMCQYYKSQQYCKVSIAYTTKVKDIENELGRATRFDTDSFPILIDNCCSRSLSHHKGDFIPGTIHDINQRVTIRGFGDTSTPILHCGTIKWSILDDHGNERIIIIQNSYYVPTAGVRLLSLQHWAQEMMQIQNQGIVCTTYGDIIILQWDGQQYQRTVPIIQASCNTGVMWATPKYTEYVAYHSVFVARKIDKVTEPSARDQNLFATLHYAPPEDINDQLIDDEEIDNQSLQCEEDLEDGDEYNPIDI